MIKAISAILVSVMMSICVVSALAVDSPIKLTLSSQKEVVTVGKDKKSHVTYESAAKVKRNDVVVYTMVCENTGKETVKNLEITDPVTTGMAYIDGSATDADKKVSQISFSIDKGKTYAVADKLTYKLTDSNGKVVEKKAPPEMYTNIKWLVTTLSPGEKISVQFRAKVL